MTTKVIAVARSFVLVGLSVLGIHSSCLQDDFKITTQSPKGTYTLVFEGKKTPTDTIAGSYEMVKLTVLKGDTVYFVKDPFFGEKGLDLHFRGAYPSREWVSDFALRLGGDLSSQPFRDQITVINATGEALPVVELFYGKYQRFILFDFESQAKLRLFASPEFGSAASPAWSVIYTALNPTGNLLVQGSVDGVKRQNPSEGPLDLVVTIRKD